MIHLSFPRGLSVATLLVLLVGCDQPAWMSAAAGASDRTGPGTPVTRYGKTLELQGDAKHLGDPAPDFLLPDLTGKEIRLSSLRGKVVLVSVVPSLDTPVCANQTHRFNEFAPDLGPDVAVLTVSADSTFDQARYCKVNDVRNLIMLSDAQRLAFGQAYGVRIAGKTILARAVFVIDRKGVIRHIELVGEQTNEPDYAAALRAVHRLREEK